jgi:hypothetical protein
MNPLARVPSFDMIPATRAGATMQAPVSVAMSTT